VLEIALDNHEAAGILAVTRAKVEQHRRELAGAKAEPNAHPERRESFGFSEISRRAEFPSTRGEEAAAEELSRAEAERRDREGAVRNAERQGREEYERLWRADLAALDEEESKASMKAEAERGRRKTSI
jgi:hypothetical protein